MPMDTEELVRPANLEEQVLGKIHQIRINNLTTRQKKDAYLIEKDMVDVFRELVFKHYGIYWDQVLELPDDELRALFDLVHKRAKRIARMIKIPLWATPILGWVAIIIADNDSSIFALDNKVRELKRMRGEIFNPTKIIRTYADQFADHQ